MGIIKAPSLESYWSENKLYQIEAFCRVMTRDRFMKILHHLHLADNDDIPQENDKLAKFRPFLNLLNKSCKNAWSLSAKFSMMKDWWCFKEDWHSNNTCQTNLKNGESSFGRCVIRTVFCTTATSILVHQKIRRRMNLLLILL